MLEGKTIVVTGVASGIGAETARTLRTMGASVVGVDRVTPTHGDCHTFHEADLSDPRAIDRLVDALPSGLNGLCNIAGLPPTAPPAFVLKVNALGLRQLTLSLIHKFANGASIVNLASLAGLDWAKSLTEIEAFHDVGFDDVDAFCERFDIHGARSYFFSKEYLIAWTYANRWTWRARNIRMNCVSPGPVETPILKDFIATLGARVEEDMKIMDRSATPADIAPVVAFLQTDGARWFRGANLTADGGMSSHIALARLGL
ncbi:3-alpha-hydroxysteroid dehydrogenase (plasmid) [Paraburkholderia sp. PGU19]|uniref:coniferyl-alcohol dehydrogenase n=1 Tax=Paraburkholderia sp. PGU19 TaxID=2735434 RepID=UPI0015DA516D|nr:coniferyl-alcohol dehydrogenase [Paraburkholderia sp. PGU19]BCG04485.1 3-alpha-hydroxysteroid dehydrogenase [Paraburkholderia sp. PGU19]